MVRARRHLKLAMTLSFLLLLGANVYANPYFWGSFGFPGFGFGISYTYAPQPQAGYAPPPPHNAAPVELHVTPKKADVIIDGTIVGQARDFSSAAYPLWLNAGGHTLEFRHEGYQTLRVRFDVKRGKAYRVHYDLHKGEGLDPRSSKRAQVPPAEPKTN